MLPTRPRRIAIAVLFALALLGGYTSVRQAATASALPANTLWGWVK